MSSTPSGPQTPGGVPPAPQKSSGTKVLLWVVGIVVGLILISFASCAVLGFYAMHKVKQAGFDSDLMKKNPGLATAKMAVAMSPDTEIVSSDDNAGTIVVRDKKTGKVVTMKFDPQKKAMVITDENGKTTSMTMAGEGANARMEMKSSEGTMKIGSGSDKAPDWVPVYPGSSPQNTFSAKHLLSQQRRGANRFLHVRHQGRGRQSHILLWGLSESGGLCRVQHDQQLRWKSRRHGLR